MLPYSSWMSGWCQKRSNKWWSNCKLRLPSLNMPMLFLTGVSLSNKSDNRTRYHSWCWKWCKVFWRCLKTSGIFSSLIGHFQSVPLRDGTLIFRSHPSSSLSVIFGTMKSKLLLKLPINARKKGASVVSWFWRCIDHTRTRWRSWYMELRKYLCFVTWAVHSRTISLLPR